MIYTSMDKSDSLTQAGNEQKIGNHSQNQSGSEASPDNSEEFRDPSTKNRSIIEKYSNFLVDWDNLKQQIEDDLPLAVLISSIKNNGRQNVTEEILQRIFCRSFFTENHPYLFDENKTIISRSHGIDRKSVLICFKGGTDIFEITKKVNQIIKNNSKQPPFSSLTAQVFLGHPLNSRKWSVVAVRNPLSEKHYNFFGKVKLLVKKNGKHFVVFESMNEVLPTMEKIQSRLRLVQGGYFQVSSGDSKEAPYFKFVNRADNLPTDIEELADMLQRSHFSSNPKLSPPVKKEELQKDPVAAKPSEKNEEEKKPTVKSKADPKQEHNGKQEVKEGTPTSEPKGESQKAKRVELSDSDDEDGSFDSEEYERSQSNISLSPILKVEKKNPPPPKEPPKKEPQKTKETSFKEGIPLKPPPPLSTEKELDELVDKVIKVHFSSDLGDKLGKAQKAFKSAFCITTDDHSIEYKYIGNCLCACVIEEYRVVLEIVAKFQQYKHETKEWIPTHIELSNPPKKK
jgi:hypothetical protein